jgi:hypothetical protein
MNSAVQQGIKTYGVDKITVLKKKYLFIIVFAFVPLLGWILVYRESRIVIIKETKLMSQPVPDGLKPDNSVVEVLSVGTEATILEENETKEWLILKIRNVNGSQGYIFGDVHYRRVE